MFFRLVCTSSLLLIVYCFSDETRLLVCTSETVTMNCTFQGHSNISWVFNHSRLMMNSRTKREDDVLKGEYHLQIENISTLDAGKYTCLRNSVSAFEQYIFLLTVEDDPKCANIEDKISFTPNVKTGSSEKGTLQSITTKEEIEESNVGHTTCQPKMTDEERWYSIPHIVIYVASCGLCSIIILLASALIKYFRKGILEPNMDSAKKPIA